MQQNLRDGSIAVVDAPAPLPGPGEILVRTHLTLLSAGTERSLLEWGRASLVGKARREPARLREAFAKARTDGVLATLDAVRAKLDRPHAPGYCNVGTVVGLGPGTEGLSIGARVVSNGGHAEVVAVARNLCVPVPPTVDDEAAVFAVLGAVALQAARLAEPTFGEAVAVIGLGLIGLLAVQILVAQGCRVLAVDLMANRLELAQRFGAEIVDCSTGADPVAAAQAFSRGRGMDAVLLATATDSPAPIRQAAQMARQRGRIVLAGTAGLSLDRAPFYAKELSFRVSCSYGPGRYDPAYERGQDYPAGLVRWTAERNLEAVLDAMAAGRIDTASLVSHRFALDAADQAYAVLGGAEPSLGILLGCPHAPSPELLSRNIQVLTRQAQRTAGPLAFGVIGAGHHATATLLPALRAASADIRMIASRHGADAAHAARRFGIPAAGSDAEALIADPGVNAVAITTRHDSHAALAAAALRAGKHVLVEKPLAVDEGGLAEVEAAWAETRGFPVPPVLAVGFNRRFSPHALAMRAHLAARPEPKALVITVNAGPLPATHWAHRDGGRILGEACHFIDLARFLIGAPIIAHSAAAMQDATGDTATLTLRFEDGSIATIHYLGNGARGFPKERVEAFCGGGILRIDNFRALRAWNWPGSVSRHWRLRPDKGHAACAKAFVQAGRDGTPPVPFAELIEVARTAIALAERAR